MSLILYQLGSTVLNLHATSLSGYEVEIPRVWRGEVERLGEAPIASLNAPYGLLEPTEVSISGTLLFQHGQDINMQLNRLTALGGQPYVDVIGYLPNDCCALGSACGVCNGVPRKCVEWLHTLGFIPEINASYVRDESSFSPSQGIPVEMTVILRDYWYPINPWVWEPYYANSPVSGLRRLDDAYLSPIPCKAPPSSYKRPANFIWNKKNYRWPFELYSPEVWASMPNARGRGWGNWTEYPVGDNAARWSAPPTANYMFTDLPTSGEIIIDVESEVGGFSRLASQSWIDLAALHQQVIDLGYGGVRNSDILIATDSVYAPSIYVRDDLILPIYPIWTYRYQYVGQLHGPENRVAISTPIGVRSAHLHVYRMA